MLWCQRPLPTPARAAAHSGGYRSATSPVVLCKGPLQLAKWLTVYRTMNIEPPVYLLNNMGPHRARGPNNSIKVTNTDVNELFSHNPFGGTPLTEVIASALADHKMEAPDQVPVC